MATGGLYGYNPIGALVAAPGAESSGLYGNATNFGGTYFEWFIFKESATQPSTPTGGVWDFVNNTGTAPTGWTVAPPSNPTNYVWISIAIVNSRDPNAYTWSTPGRWYVTGLAVLSGVGVPTGGVDNQYYIQTDLTPQAIWFRESGTWVKLTGSSIYADLTSNQTIAGVKTFSNTIQGNISGNAANVTGTVAIANGGTGQTTANSAFNSLAPSQTGNSGKYLTTDGSNTSWAANPLGTVTSVAATAGTGISVTGSPITTSGTLNIVNTAPDQTVAIASGTGISVTGTYPNFTVTNTSTSSGGTVTSVNVSGGTTGLTTSGGPVTTSGTIALAGTLAVANGGTGVTVSTGANSVVLRDANQNITANAYFNGFTSVAASGTPITLTVGSAPVYLVTGSGGQTIQLPNATTLPNGTIFSFNNNQSSGAITVNNNSGTLVVSVPSGAYVTVVLLSNAIAAGSWDRHDQTPSNVSWSTNTFDYPGSITSATWNGVAVAINRGGTGASTKATAFNALSPMSAAGDVIYGGTSGAGTALAIGTAGQVLTVNSGATAPQWSTPTTGTVTSVSGTGTVNGLSLSGTVTSSGNLTFGGTLDLSSPPAIGSTAASTGRFTTVTSTIATGTAPFTVASTTPVANLSIGGNAGTVTNGVYTTDTGTVTNTMLAGSITNAKLVNSSITFGSTAQALGSTVSALSGVSIDNGAIGATTASTGTFTTVTATTVNIAAAAANAGLTLLRDTGTATRSSRIFLDASGGVAAIYNNANSILFNTSATIGSSSGTQQFTVSHTASAVDYVQITGATTASKVVVISAQGSDADVTLSLAPKGAGTVRFGTHTGTILTPTGYITITDSGGTSRRLLVG